MKSLKKIIYSFGYLGFVPKCPGTFGTLGGVVIWVFVAGNIFWHGIACLIVLFFGLWSVNEAVKIYHHQDPQVVVIDEVMGFLVASFAIGFSWQTLLATFILFRVFDIIKPFPCRDIEALRSPWGIILDDVMAGFYANISVRTLIYFWNIS